MADITHEHLQAFATHIEDATRREVDRLREEVKDDLRQLHGRVSELRDHVKAQNGRVTRSEEALAQLRTEVAVLNAMTARERRTALADAAADAVTDIGKPKLVVAAVAALAALAGFLEVARELVARALQAAS